MREGSLLIVLHRGDLARLRHHAEADIERRGPREYAAHLLSIALDELDKLEAAEATADAAA
ncbi:MAG TPA: hypothetical protein VFB50_17755 [Chloroflexota bacterium]|nr:hypothetical protein [Chloroflexota bacterium]